MPGRPEVPPRRLRPGRPGAAALAAAALTVLAACGGATPARHSAGTTTSSTPAPPASSTSSAPPGSTSSSSTTAAGTGVRNLVVSATVRAQLLAAGAAMNELPAADYTGLVAGTTYYAYDPATATYWAGAGLVPSPTSTPAQVSVQDDGSYVLYEMVQGGAWQARPVGLGATPGQHACPSALPAAVVALWHWAPGTCRPPG